MQDVAFFPKIPENSQSGSSVFNHCSMNGVLDENERETNYFVW